MDGHRRINAINISTTDGHQLHVEESGPVDGIPLLFLHGGPGASIGQHYLWPFNGLPYRVIAFDQRGCGKSKPFGTLENNTTEHLIGDIELIRQHFNIDKWVLFGGSWGSTLALAYAIQFPERTYSMVLRGIFLAREQDADWFLSPSVGASQVFPTQYNRLRMNCTSRQEICNAYFEQLTNKDERTRDNAAARWFDWEGSISKLQHLEENSSEIANKQQVYSLALMECYYLLNQCFMKENHILENAHKLQSISSYIVHGRYDMVCKCEAAITLHEHLPNSQLMIVDDAGHSMNEKGISKALIKALKHLANSK